MKKCPHCGELIGDNVVDKCPICFKRLGETVTTEQEIKPNTMATTVQPEIVVTTTDTIEGYIIKRYIECVFGVDSYVFISYSADDKNEGAFKSAESKMISKARSLGANAIVGVKFGTVMHDKFGVIIVNATGTAVFVEKAEVAMQEE